MIGTPCRSTHKPRKRYIPKRIEIDTMGLAHAQASLLQPAQRRDLCAPVRSAFARLRTGRGDWGAWCSLADAFNVAERLASLGIASDRMAEFEAGQAALAALHGRHAERGGWVLRGPEIAALDAAIELHEVQLEVCTQGEMAEAITTVKRCVAQALAGNTGPRTTVCVGVLGSVPDTALHATHSPTHPEGATP